MILCRTCAHPHARDAIGAAECGCQACGTRGGDLYSIATPVSCRRCRQIDMNEFLHRNSHGNTPRIDHCMAQHLRRNHLIYAVRRDDAEQVREYLARFLEVWQHMPADQWAADVDAARERIDQLERVTRAPEHHELIESEEVALW